MKTEVETQVGEQLRAARIAQGIDLSSISKAIRVPSHYLQAIEEGRYDALPGTPYAIGFIRSYAQHLSLSAADLVECFKAEANPSGPIYTTYWREPELESRLPQRPMIFAGLIGALGIYSLWFSLSGSPVALPSRPVVPDHLLARAEPVTLDAVVSLTQSEDAPVEVEAPSAAVASAEKTTQQSVAPTVVAEANSEPPATVYTPAAGPVENSQTETAPLHADETSQAATSQAAKPTQMVTVELVEDAWLHVTEGDRILFSGVLSAGRRYTPPAGEAVVMTTGNAGGIILRLNDWVSGPLGRSGRVRRNIPLDAQSWRSKLAQADAL